MITKLTHIDVATENKAITQLLSHVMSQIVGKLSSHDVTQTLASTTGPTIIVSIDNVKILEKLYDLNFKK